MFLSGAMQETHTIRSHGYSKTSQNMRATFHNLRSSEHHEAANKKKKWVGRRQTWEVSDPDGKVSISHGDHARGWRPKHRGLGWVSKFPVPPALSTCRAGNSPAPEWDPLSTAGTFQVPESRQGGEDEPASLDLPSGLLVIASFIPSLTW